MATDFNTPRSLRIERLKAHLHRKPNDLQAALQLQKLERQAAQSIAIDEIYKRVYADVSCPVERAFLVHADAAGFKPGSFGVFPID